MPRKTATHAASIIPSLVAVPTNATAGGNSASTMNGITRRVSPRYAAVTSKDGSFKIEKLPAGKHEFRVWHERVGYVNAGEKRGFEIEVADGETTDLGTVKVPLKVFEE